MQRTKAWKTQTALLLISILLLTMLPMSAFGAEGDGNAPAGEKPTISVDFLGFAGKNDGFGLGPSDQPVAKDRALTVEDGVFWIGVSLDNLYNATFIREGGIRDLEIGFDYNPKYVTPVSNLEYDPTDPNNSKVDADGWLKLIQDYNLTSADAVDNADRWSSANYEIDGEASIYSTQLDESYGREFTSPDDWKMMFVTVARTSEITAEENEKNRFTGITDSETDAGSHYILRAPFRLVDVPDGEDKPFVLRLTLGPSTLVMTTGMNGDIGYAWEKETRTEDNYNLKNIFSFNGDINLFQADGANNLNGMSVAHTLTGSTDEISNQLFGDAEMVNEVTFRPTDKEYYVKVGSTADKALITMVGPTKEPQVTHRVASGGGTTTPCAITHDVTQSAWIAEIPLTEIVKDEDGFDDVVKISIAQEGADAIEYIVYIKKEEEITGEAKIVLHPGNSPYGLIERMATEYHGAEGAWDEDKIAAAKEEFNKGNRFVAGYVPDGGNINQEYSPNAWIGEYGDVSNIENSEINLDRNEYTQVLFNGTKFVDAGFVAYDSFGNKVDDKLVTRTITVKKMNDADVNTMKDDMVEDETIVLSNIENDAESDAFENLSYIRPGIYEMKYTYFDSYSNSTAEASRKIVILWELGDSDLSGILNSTDADVLNHLLAGRINLYSGVAEEVLNVYKFRILDYDQSSVVNSTDADTINHVLAGRIQSTFFYSNLYRH